ncbi:MAG: CDP-archaeol synthase, partial [Patescibacteria group bacterium]
KTYRGLLSGILFGIIAIFLQQYLASFPWFEKISLLPYREFNAWQLIFVGALLGAGALLGDLLKSFFKRRLNIPAGEPWVPFDQLDFVVGALVAVSLVYPLPLWHTVAVMILTVPLHFIVNLAAFAMGLKKVWW